MERWPAILLLLLAALLWGCGSGHDARVMAELDRADSLLLTSDTAAHSAAMIFQCSMPAKRKNSVEITTTPTCPQQ